MSFLTPPRGPDERRTPPPAEGGSPRITALVVTYNAVRLAPSLIETLGRLESLATPLIVDNASSDGTADMLERALMPGMLVRSGWNGGFGYANNLGLMRVRTPYTLLLNADARIGPESLSALEARLDASPGTAAVQPRLGLWEWPEVTAGRGLGITAGLRGFDLGFMRFEPEPGNPGPRPVPGVGAAVSLWRTRVLRSVGGFDERFFMYFEDVDLCLRTAAAGYSFELLPGAWGLHMVGSSSRRSEAEAWETRSAALLARKYLGGRAARMPVRTAFGEFRDIARCALRGRPPFRRLGAFVSAVLEPSIQPERIPRLPAPAPTDLPSIRPGRPFHLDRGGTVTAGPGWSASGSGVSFSGYGAMSVRSPGTVSILLESDIPHTGRLWLGAEPGPAFHLPSGRTLVRLPVPAGRSYLALDDRVDMPTVRMLDFDFEGRE